MEEKTRSTTVQGMYYGAITGIAIIVFSLIIFVADLYLNRSITWIGYLILLGGMIWGTLDYRKNYMNGFMSYGKAFSTSFMIGLFTGILAAVYTYVFAQFIHPGFTQEILDMSREQMLASSPNLSEEQIDQALSYTAKFTTPLMMLIFGFITYVVISAIISLITSIFLKKEDKSLTTSV